MRSNYKRLGDLVKRIDLRNSNMELYPLKGVSISKEFIDSVANVNGTDLKKYKIVKNKQYVANLMHVDRDRIVPVSMWCEETNIIVSPAYDVFELNNTININPEYLMLCFRMHTFDRNAWFLSGSSIRGNLSWDNFCDIMIPVPNIETQDKIVNNYRRITTAIRINEILQEKLDMLGLNFVELLTSANAETVEIKSLVNVITGKKNAEIATIDGEYAFFTCSKNVYYTQDYSFEGNAILVAGNGAFDVKYYSGKFEAYQRTYVLIPENKKIVGLLYFYVKSKLNELTKGNRGSVIDFIVKSMIEDFEIKIPTTKQSDDIKKIFNSLVKYIDFLFKSNRVLHKIRELYVSNIVAIEG